MPSSSLATGGLMTRMCLRPDGAPLSSTSSTGASRMRSASSLGLAMVALAQMKIGIGAVVVADPAQAADDVRHVAAEQAPVGVQLVDDDVLEVLEQLEPLRVVRKDRRVEHVRVGDDHLPGRADHAAHVGGRVAVVGVRLEADLGGAGQRAQLHQLVRRQRLGGEQVERASRLVLRHRVDDGQVVAERLARCGRRHHHDVLPRADGLVGCRLVRVQRLDPAAPQRLDEPRVEPIRPGGVARRPRLELAVRGDQRRERRVGEEGGDRLIGIAQRGGQHRRPPAHVVQTEHLFASDDSTGVRMLRSRCDSSPVARDAIPMLLA